MRGHRDLDGAETPVVIGIGGMVGQLIPGVELLAQAAKLGPQIVGVGDEGAARGLGQLA